MSYTASASAARLIHEKRELKAEVLRLLKREQALMDAAAEIADIAWKAIRERDALREAIHCCHLCDVEVDRAEAFEDGWHHVVHRDSTVLVCGDCWDEGLCI